MKKFLIQVCTIVILSIAIGLVFNRFQDSPLQVFKAFNPDQVQDAAEDLSAFFNEIDAETVTGMMDADMAVLLDARTRENYNNGHLPKAISLPISDFNQAYNEVSPLLNTDKAIIIYCIGVHCIDSSLLAKELYQKGFREIFVYKGGIEDWTAQNLPIEHASDNMGGDTDDTDDTGDTGGNSNE